MVLLEAMAAGLPVVSTRVEGIPELVRSGQDGLLVEAADPQALAAALLKFARSEVDAEAMGDSGWQRQREHFSDISMAAAVANIYREVLNDVTITDTESEPVFVVGMNGSGTTMLLDCLGRHPALYAFPRETRLIPYLIAREGRPMATSTSTTNFRRLWDDVRNLAVFQADRTAVSRCRCRRNWRDYPRTLGADTRRECSRISPPGRASSAGARRPRNTRSTLSLWRREFPSARFIHVIRDGRDCAVSFHRRWRRQPELTVFRWKKVVGSGREQGTAPRCGTLPGSALRRPDRRAREVAAPNLRVPGSALSTGVLDSAQPYLQPVARRRATGGLQRNSGKWRDYFSAGTVEHARTHRRPDPGSVRLCHAGLPDCDQRRGGLAPQILVGHSRRCASTRARYTASSMAISSGRGTSSSCKPLNALRQRQHNEY